MSSAYCIFLDPKDVPVKGDETTAATTSSLRDSVSRSSPRSSRRTASALRRAENLRPRREIAPGPPVTLRLGARCLFLTHRVSPTGRAPPIVLRGVRSSPGAQAGALQKELQVRVSAEIAAVVRKHLAGEE